MRGEHDGPFAKASAEESTVATGNNSVTVGDFTDCGIVAAAAVLPIVSVRVVVCVNQRQTAEQGLNISGESALMC